MANNTQNVTLGKPKVSGAVFTAPFGAALPTDASTTLAETYKPLGYVSEDGFRNTNSPESTELKAWGGDTVATLQTSKNDTFALKLIEALNVDVLKAVYNEENVTGTLEKGVTVRANSSEADARVWVVDMVMTNGTLKRIVIPNAKITSIGEIVYKDNEAVGYDLTLTAMPGNDAFDYDTHKEYIIKPTAEG